MMDDDIFKDSLAWCSVTPQGGIFARNLPNIFKCFCEQHPLPEAPPYFYSTNADGPPSSVLISGVGRSASTVTWQMLDILAPGSVLKSHSFTECCPTMFNFKKIIITIRHPFDQVFSVKKTHQNDNRGRSEFLNIALKEWEDARKFVLLKKLQTSIGYRPDMKIEFLKYEDFWNKDLERINFLSNFMGIKLNAQQTEKLLAETSIEKNLERSKKAAGKGYVWGVDQSGHKLERKINANHVDDKRGIPGQGKDLDRFIKQNILDNCEWAFEEFGYNKDF